MKLSFGKNKHLDGLSFKFASYNLMNTCSNLVRHSSVDFADVIMSSIYNNDSIHWMSRSTSSISLWKVEGLFTSPNGITLKWYTPQDDVEKAVLYLSSSSFSICQNPEHRFIVLNNFDPDNASRHSSIFERDWRLQWLPHLTYDSRRRTLLNCPFW